MNTGKQHRTIRNGMWRDPEGSVIEITTEPQEPMPTMQEIDELISNNFPDIPRDKIRISWDVRCSGAGAGFVNRENPQISLVLVVPKELDKQVK